MIAPCMSNDKKSFQKVCFLGCIKTFCDQTWIFFSKQINKLCATTVEYNLRDKYNDNYIIPKERCSKAPMAICSMDARVNSLFIRQRTFVQQSVTKRQSFFRPCRGLIIDDLLGTLIIGAGRADDEWICLILMCGFTFIHCLIYTYLHWTVLDRYIYTKTANLYRRVWTDMQKKFPSASSKIRSISLPAFFSNVYKVSFNHLIHSVWQYFVLSGVQLHCNRLFLLICP